MTKILSKMLIASLAILPAHVVMAASPLQLSSDVFVERQIKRTDGSVATVLEKPKMVVPGDSLVFVVKYKNVGPAAANNFTVTNPLPRAVAFNGTSDGLEIVSVDGGVSWGPLAKLRVIGSDGKSRTARMTDVTHIKWNLAKTLLAGSEGKLMFRGVVK